MQRYVLSCRNVDCGPLEEASERKGLIMRGKKEAWSVAFFVALMLTGCGGGGGGGGSAATSSVVTTGKAYYVDAAVSGVGYICGSQKQKSVTAADGEFVFEKGSGCTFYLGEMKLREVEASSLENGGTVYETDEKIARVLQSLDSDGDPENGIVIDDGLVNRLSVVGYDQIPRGDDALEDFLQIIAENGGTVVSKEHAKAHMLQNLLAGRTLYLLRYDSVRSEKRPSGWKTVRIDFDDSSVTWHDETIAETFAYTIDTVGNIVLLSDDEYGGRTLWTPIEITKDHLKLCEDKECGLYLFYDEDRAEAFIKGLITHPGSVTMIDIKGLDDNVKETSGLAYIDGRLFTINDSGGSNVVYEIDAKAGDILRTVTIKDAANVDWESLAFDGSYLYIADIGNNQGNRKDLKIYKVAKKEILENDTADAEIISFSYADQNRFDYDSFTTPYDAEALVAYEGNLYVFTKNWQDYTTHIYKIPNDPGSYEAFSVDKRSLDILVTGASIDSKSSTIALVGYTNPHEASRTFKSAVVKLSGFLDERFFSGRMEEYEISGGQFEALSFKISPELYVSAEGVTSGFFDSPAKLYEIRMEK